MNKKRFIILVIDGLGVGEMDDVSDTRPQDVGSHTLRSVVNYDSDLFPNLNKLGILDYFIHNKNSSIDTSIVSLGKLKLAHFGADSFMGHQEIAGTLPKFPIRQFVRDEYENIIKELNKHNIDALFNGKFIEIGDDIAIADNVETDYGLNINVVGSIDTHPYDEIERIGKAVRNVAQVGRVITMGGNNVTKEKLLNAFEIKERDGFTAWGINIPKLNIYNDQYKVIHMGYGIDASTQIPEILSKTHVPVTLIGKAADVISAQNAEYIPEVYTDKVISHLKKALKIQEYGLIFANIQETDLSGHREDVNKYAYYLSLFDTALPEIIDLLDEEDVMVVTGDHGNDPLIGHTNHTREFTPLIMISKNKKYKSFDTRDTLSDIGATVSDFFNVDKPENGTSLFN